MPVIANGNKWQLLMCCFLPTAQIWWQTGSKSSTELMKIEALLSNGKYWQNKAQLKNSKKRNKFYIVLKWQRLAKFGRSKLQQKWHKCYHGI